MKTNPTLCLVHFSTSSVLILDLWRDNFYGSSMSKPPNPARLLFSARERRLLTWSICHPSIHLPFIPFLWLSHPFSPAPNAAITALSSLPLPFLLTNLSSLSCPPAPLCLYPTKGGISVIGFVCTRCAGFEGAQMVVIGVVLWDYVEGRHLSVL